MEKRLLHIDRIEENVVLFTDASEHIFFLSKADVPFSVTDGLAVTGMMEGETLVSVLPFDGEDATATHISALMQRLFHKNSDNETR